MSTGYASRIADSITAAQQRAIELRNRIQKELDKAYCDNDSAIRNDNGLGQTVARNKIEFCEELLKIIDGE